MVKHWDRTCWHTEIVSQAELTARVTPDTPIEYLKSPRWFERYPFGQVRRLSDIRKFVAKAPPDILHCYFFWSIIYGRILKRLGKIQILVESREDQGFNWDRHEYVWLRMTRTMPDRVICVSEAVRQVVLKREGIDPARVLVVHNGVEPVQELTESKSSARRELGITEDNLVVGMVANFNRPVKGVSYFLDAIPSIVRAVPAARFLILGRGKEQQSLQDKAKALGIESHVVFAGYQNEVGHYYSIMDISVLTSLSEGLSITLLESMSYGIPVVATQVGGNPEVVVDGQTGYLVPPRDVPSFVDRVVKLLHNPDLRSKLGQESLRRIKQKFQMQDTANRYLEVYSGLLGPSGLPSASCQRRTSIR